MSTTTLFISDLDGTLLDSHGRLPVSVRTAIGALLEKGVQLTLASARSHFSIKSLFGDLPFSLPIIEFNGAFITDYHSGRHLTINAIESELCLAVYQQVLAFGLRPFVSTFDGALDCLYFDELINVGMVWYEQRRRDANDPRLRRTTDLQGTLKESVVSLTVMAQEEDAIRKLQEELWSCYGNRLRTYCYENEYSKGTWWLTIHDPRASKHVAMRTLRDEFVPRAKIVAFGDNENDIEMIRTADWGVAVGNAVPPLRAVADEIIGTNLEGSVTAYLMRLAGVTDATS